MAAVVIYTTRFCPYCHSAKALLEKKGAPFTEIDVSGDREARQRMIEGAGGHTTVPQIFIGATHIGGCDELYELDEAGRLDPLLAGAQGQPA